MRHFNAFDVFVEADCKPPENFIEGLNNLLYNSYLYVLNNAMTRCHIKGSILRYFDHYWPEYPMGTVIVDSLASMDISITVKMEEVCDINFECDYYIDYTGADFHMGESWEAVKDEPVVETPDEILFAPIKPVKEQSNYDEYLITTNIYDEYLAQMRDQDTIMFGLNIKDDPVIDPTFALEKYKKWTEEDVKHNEELFKRHNFPTDQLHPCSQQTSAARPDFQIEKVEITAPSISLDAYVDLKYFTTKMLESLQVPYSVLIGPEEKD